MKIKVSEKQIKTAIKKNSHHCMIADAIKAAVPDAKYIRVDLQSIRFSNLKKGLRYKFFTPPLAQHELINFDQGNKVEPFTINLVKAAELKKVGWQANHPHSKSRKGKKYNKTGKKRSYRVTKERQFGICSLQ